MSSEETSDKRHLPVDADTQSSTKQHALGTVRTDSKSPYICGCATVPPPKAIGRYAEALDLVNQFMHESDVAAADQAVAIFTAILEADAMRSKPPPHSRVCEEPNPSRSNVTPLPERHHVLMELARTFDERARYTDDQTDTDKAVQYSKEALDICRARAIICPSVYMIYARVLDLDAETLAHAQARQTADVLCRQAIQVCGTGHPLKPSIRRILGWILFRLFQGTGTSSYLEDAIHLQRAALTDLAVSDIHRHRHLRYLGIYLICRYELLTEPVDLDSSLSIFEDAIRLCPPTHIDRSRTVHDMLSAVYRRCFQTGTIHDLDKAVDIGRHILETEASCGRTQIYSMSMLSTILSLRHELTLSYGRDMDESIYLEREILQRSPPESVDHWMYLHNLSLKLRLRFEWSGKLDDLSEAILFGRQADDALPENHPRRFSTAHNLSTILALRFSEAGNIADLDDALFWGQRAASTILPSHSAYLDITSDYISRLCTRFETIHSMSDLETAISLGNECLAAIPDTHVNKAKAIHCLSRALLLRGRHTNNRTDIDGAIAYLEGIADGFSQRADGQVCLPTLAACYLTRFRQIHDHDDALRAQKTTKHLLANISAGRRGRCQCLVDAAELYVEPGTTYCDIPMALSYLEEALIDDERDVRSRIQYVTHVLDLIQQRHQDVFKAESPTTLQLLGVYERVVGLLPLVAYFDLHPRARLRSLTIGQSTAITGASLALQLSRPEKALELLEQGRAIFWTHTLHLRSPFDAVPDAFRDRLATLAQQLDKVCDSSQENNDARIVDAQISRRRKQTEEFNLLLDEVRKIPGMEHFLMPLPFSVLTRAAERGPVVVLVPSSMACHALILKSCGHMIKIPLEPVVTESWLADTGAGWRTAVANARSVSVDRLKMSKTRPTQRVDNILRRLWHSIVKPVLTALEISPSTCRQRPRLWWCPTGPFVHLPIHAAGADGQWCSDYVVSSYTPTLSALLGIRLNYTPVKKQDVRALVAAVPRPHAQQWSDLASTREELDLVQASLPAGSLIPLSTSDNASVLIGSRDGVSATSILERLPQATILHLACHAHQDPDNPLESGFVMHDEMLTIEKLMAIPLQRAFMAFLSACETAKGDKNQPDQTIHLAATMLYAGFKTVIATLWSMNDLDGPTVAQTIYAYVFDGDGEYINPDDVPYALDAAVQRLRQTQSDPSRWAPYVHIGI